MNVLFLHQNFPGQYRHIAAHLAQDTAHQVHFLTHANDTVMPGVQKIVYAATDRVPKDVHPDTVELDRVITVGSAAAEAASQLARDGYRPDLIVGHSGWGETLYLRDVFPGVPVLANFEFYYHAKGADVGFDPEFDSVFNSAARLRTRNATALMAFEACDWGHTATAWQHSLHPEHIRARLSQLHEGVDTNLLCPNANARFRLPTGRILTPSDDVITFVARNLEPYRGFHSFMRSLPAILKAHPKAQVVIVGSDDVGYGAPPPPGSTFRQALLDELSGRIDTSRIHFLGSIDYVQYIQLLQVSSVHTYLTYPFVLSWSFIEALSIGCVMVGSKTAPVLEVLEDGVNGLTVDFFSTDEIAAAIHDALSDPKRMKKIRTAARRTAIKRYDLNKRQLPRWIRLFEDLIAGHEPARDED
jgi:glycosyltransferase involved in cell wall biosynthesis